MGKTFLAAFLILLSIALAPLCAQAQNPSPEGFWWTKSRTVKIQIYRTTTGALAGKIVWLHDAKDEKGRPRTDILNPNEKLRGRPVLGMVILQGLKAEDANTWAGGTIYDPKHGNRYSCKLELLSANSLELRGYKGISLLGKSTSWTRAN